MMPYDADLTKQGYESVPLLSDYHTYNIPYTTVLSINNCIIAVLRFVVIRQLD